MFQFLGQFFGDDGSIRFLFAGLTFMSSVWSDGLRRTKFTVNYNNDGNISISRWGKSREPYAGDVLEALNFLLGGTGKEKASRLFYREPRIGTSWVSDGRYDARINEASHLSLRDRLMGNLAVSQDFLRAALPTLFEWLEEEDSGSDERQNLNPNQVFYEGKPLSLVIKGR